MVFQFSSNSNAKVTVLSKEKNFKAVKATFQLTQIIITSLMDASPKKALEIKCTLTYQSTTTLDNT